MWEHQARQPSSICKERRDKLEQPRVLIANRGEIAIRVARTAIDRGIATYGIFAEDDEASLHTSVVDVAVPLEGVGIGAYMDIDQIVAIAVEHNCAYIHPGYGFLSENPAFAEKAEAAGIVFLGPKAETLYELGDKANAKAIADRCDVPTARGTNAATTLEDAKAFFESLEEGVAVVIKPLAGGGGRGIRVAHSLEELDYLYQQSASESLAVLNDDRLLIEEYMPRSRHIEIQIIGDGNGNAYFLGARDCSVQRRFQKIVEIAPPFGLDDSVIGALAEAAVRIARTLKYRSLGTFEFLVDADGSGRFIFMEVNPRIQVEHTVTEAASGLDLVDLQFRLAESGEIDESVAQTPTAGGRFAVQVRVNSETIGADGQVSPSGGTLTTYLPPSGPGVRVDSAAYPGYKINPRYDSLLAKLIVFGPESTFEQAIAKTYRALSEYTIAGVQTNLELLREICYGQNLTVEALDTNYLEPRLAGFLASEASHQLRHSRVETAEVGGAHGAQAEFVSIPEGSQAVSAHLSGVLSYLLVEEGAAVASGQPIAVVEAMKMEHEIFAPVGGKVVLTVAQKGDAIAEGDILLAIEAEHGDGEAGGLSQAGPAETIDLDHMRDDLAHVNAYRERIYDAARPEAVQKRHARGKRTIRENLGDLLVAESFLEYGPFVVADQDYDFDELISRSPADGVITGFGRLNEADQIDGGAEKQVAVIGYDYSVYAGTQGLKGHAKTDRFLQILNDTPVPLIVFGEGGGGRPNDRYSGMASGFTIPTFRLLGELNGKLPSVAIVSGPCFAGNAAFAGLCDTIIATRSSNIGMAGAALVREAGLGDFRTEDIGPIDDQTASGVVDIAVEDEEEAVAVAKKYVSFFQGRSVNWESHDQRKLRHLVPENRMRAYDMSAVIETLADVDSVLELRAEFGREAITVLARIEGYPVGIIANNPRVQSGAITSDAADKIARFLQLCNVHGIPVLSLADTPGIMVGPEVERTGIVRHSSRVFIAATRLSVPFYTVFIRKGYGLGGPAMTGGNLGIGGPHFCIAWPTAEFGPMQLEGQVRLAYGRELDAIEDETERQRRYEELVAQRYADGHSLRIASHGELDDVIDPADTRRWFASSLKLHHQTGKIRPTENQAIDAW